jgi:AAA family ATP:ADP antiporter
LSQPTSPADPRSDAPRLTPVERLLRLFTEVRPGEGRIALLMFVNVHLILFAYYLLKPLREGWLAISDIHGLSKLEVKAYTSFGQTLLLAGVAAAYGRLVEHWPRRVLISRATVFCMTNIVVFWTLQPGLFLGNVSAVGVAYYLWVGMFGVFVVAQFWAFAADLYSQERGARLLPLIAIGATSGAMLGSWLEGHLVSWGLLDTRYLLLAPLPPLAASIWLTVKVDRETGGVGKLSGARPEGEVLEGRGALPMVLGNRFLLAVAVTTLLLNWVRTNGENLLFGVVQQVLARQVAAQGIVGADAVHAFIHTGTTAFYGDFFFWVNAMALALQALVASRLLKYGGFGAIFLLLPAVALTSYSAMVLLPVLWVIKTMKIAENATDYSIHNTARHVLWLPMSQEVTFKAKPTVDSLFVRAGDGLAALTVLVGVQVFSASIRSYFAVNVSLVVVWLALAVWVVKEYARLGGDAQPGGPSRRSSEALGILGATLATDPPTADTISGSHRAGSHRAGDPRPVDQRSGDPRPAWGGGR